MRTTLRLPLLTALTALAAGAASHAEAPAPAPPPAGPPVTLAVSGEPIVDLLPTLPQDPKLAADRELGERRVIVAVKALPVETVRTALADVTSGAWSPSAAGPQHPTPDTQHPSLTLRR